jgi:hypothetical protein
MRMRQLDHAQKLDLDIINIVRKTMNIILDRTQSEMEDLFAEKGQPVLAVALTEPVTELDEVQIRAIEWVLITGSQDLTLDCLVNGNTIFRRFLRSHFQVLSSRSCRASQRSQRASGTSAMSTSHSHRTYT